MKKYGLLLFICVLFLSACAQNKVIEKPKLITKLSGDLLNVADFEQRLEEKMALHNIPGLSMAIINNGEIVYKTTKGFANKALKKPVLSSTIFEGASLSKPLFGFLVMTFVDEGLLDLDKPLYQYLPNPDLEYDARYQDITARMVLSHQSGLPNWRSDYPENKLFLKFAPGTGYFYSGEGYQYLAKVLEKLASTDAKGLEKIFQQRVAKPLNMSQSQFIPDEKILRQKPTPYKNGLAVSAVKANTEFGAAYSIHSEATDMAKWLIGIMNKKVLSPASYEIWLSPQGIKLPVEDPALQYGWRDWALGFSYYQIPETVYFHGGNNYGYTSIMGLEPDKKWGMVLFTNADQANEFTIDVMLSLK